MERKRYAEVLTCYSFIPKLRRLLQWFWSDQVVVPKAGRYYVRPFNMGRRGTQGDPISTTVFRILVNAVIRAVMIEVCIQHEANHGIGWEATKHNIAIYTYDGHIVG